MGNILNIISHTKLQKLKININTNTNINNNLFYLVINILYIK